MGNSQPAPAVDQKQGNGSKPAKPKIPNKWGVSEAKWMADQENELITIHLRGGEMQRGYLIGLDQFTIFIEHEASKAKLLIAKHAIDWIEPGTP